MKILVVIAIGLSILGCSDTKREVINFESMFDIIIEKTMYQDTIEMHGVKIIPKDSSLTIKKAYWNCPLAERGELDKVSFKIANCNKQLSIVKNNVEIWFGQTKQQDTFKMSDVILVCSKDGNIFIEETNLNLSLREFKLQN